MLFQRSNNLIFRLTSLSTSQLNLLAIANEWKNLTEKLIAENSRILNWFLQGYTMWRKEGLSEEPDAIREANTEYRMDMNSVETFVIECLDIDASQSWRLNNTFFYNTYIKWCNKNNERVMSQKWLTMRMSEKGFKRELWKRD